MERPTDFEDRQEIEHIRPSISTRDSRNKSREEEAMSMSLAAAMPASVAPVRGSLRLNVSTSSPQIGAGSDFSIFVVIQNPFDVPITINQVQTHIPIELLDVNRLRLELAKQEHSATSMSITSLIHQIRQRLTARTRHTGVAIAVGTDFDPTVERDFVSLQVKSMGDHSSMVGVQFSFPTNPNPEELDRLFRRLADYKHGLIPVTLQPGDSTVKQFVLRTRHWLLFTPLTHTFQIQVNYSGDGVDHTDTIAYGQNIGATIGAISIGACCGAVLGAVLKHLSSAESASAASLGRAVLVALLASIAVVVAFARKSAAQPIVSVEDFWGGALIGFTVGFFGFGQFSGLFGTATQSGTGG
jgi:hypothetical protein